MFYHEINVSIFFQIRARRRLPAARATATRRAAAATPSQAPRRAPRRQRANPSSSRAAASSLAPRNKSPVSSSTSLSGSPPSTRALSGHEPQLVKKKGRKKRKLRGEPPRGLLLPPSHRPLCVCRDPVNFRKPTADNNRLRARACE